LLEWATFRAWFAFKLNPYGKSRIKQETNAAASVQTAPMPKIVAKLTRAALVELIKRTNQTPIRITAQS
jgi:hypothetical protein